MKSHLTKTNMINKQIKIFGVSSRILDVIKSIPKEIFLPQKINKFVYSEIELSFGKKRLTSTNTIVKILKALDINSENKVLHLGDFDAYITVILSKLGQETYFFSRKKEAIQYLKICIDKLLINNVNINYFSSFSEFLDVIPIKFDIVVCSDHLLQFDNRYLKLLNKNGKILYFQSNLGYSKSLVMTKYSEDHIEKKSLFDIYADASCKKPSKFKF